MKIKEVFFGRNDFPTKGRHLSQVTFTRVEATGLAKI